MNGVLVIDKPAGPTSHDVVAMARRALDTRRIGHTGTLDPTATGVLPLVIGRATRLSQYLTGASKGYEAVVRLGISTDTYDGAGAPTGGRTDRVAAIGDAELAEALDAFRGEFEQMPPPYSAKKLAGVAAYALARDRRAVQPSAVRVSVYSLRLCQRDGDRVRLRVEASAGFYVRSLAHDLGERLGCGAHLEELRRYRSGGFTLDDAVALDLLLKDPASAAARIIAMEQLLPEFPSLRLSTAGSWRVAHGNAIGAADAVALGETWPARDELVRLFEADGRLLAIGRTTGTGALQPVVVLG
jgi:tRNA pseudouridine55 synthase